jgi:hypothetical protein
MPPAFTLSQDQTLKFISITAWPKPNNNTSRGHTQISLADIFPTQTITHQTRQAKVHSHIPRQAKTQRKTPATHPTPQGNSTPPPLSDQRRRPSEQDNPRPTHHSKTRDSQIKKQSLLPENPM